MHHVQLQDANRDLVSKLNRRDSELYKMRESNRYLGRCPIVKCKTAI